MEKKQLPQEEIQERRTIASLRIHVERAIGRVKKFIIYTGTLPHTLVRLSNQIVSLCVCVFLSNFHPALVPCSSHSTESDANAY